MARVLAIETSCDETSVAVVEHRTCLSNVVSSQIPIHQRYGGVVPEVASRQHLETINGTIAEALAMANLDWSSIDGIAATCAPGLVGALMVGATAAKTLAMLYKKPFLGIHHLEGHIYASYLSSPELQPPFLCLLVSGGHTSLILVKDCGNYQTLGETKDDAAGEAFDKVARLLGLGYPGGPAIDKLAQTGNPKAFPLPEGKISLPGGGFHPYDSSFSGLKTAVLRLVQKLQADPIQINLPIPDIAASFQHAVAQALTKRVVACAQDYGLGAIAIGGGVAANSGLRSHLTAAAAKHDLQVFFPPLKYCTDNAAMIACAACDHLERGHRSSLELGVRSRLPLGEVMQLFDTLRSKDTEIL
jgi:N6-L-threonylcarbamoyladenine synthase